jgi:hypothetical protein
MIKCTYSDLAGLRDQNITDAKGNVMAVRPGPLTKLAQADDKQVPLLMDRIRIGRFVRAVVTEIKEMETDAMELLRKYGKQNEQNPTNFHIPPESRDQFNKENSRLNETECEIRVLPLPESVYGKLPLTSGDLMALWKFIVLSPENQKALAELEATEDEETDGVDPDSENPDNGNPDNTLA